MPAQPEGQREEGQEQRGGGEADQQGSGERRGEQQGAQQQAQQGEDQQQQAQQGQQQPCWYSVLGVDPKASADDIRRAFRKAALQLHPDKAAASTTGDSAGGLSGGGGAGSADFLLVQQAWEVLQDPERRDEYDRQRKLAAARQQVHYNDTIELADMQACEAYGRECYSYPCRCGGRYLLLLDDVEAAGVLELDGSGGQSVSLTGPEQSPAELGVPCESCSLFVRVLLAGGSC